MSRGGAGRAPEPGEVARPLRIKWLAAAAGTVLATVGFWSVVFGASDEVDASSGVGLVAFGVSLLVLSVAALAVVSGASRLLARTARAVLIGASVFLVVVLVSLATGQIMPFSAVTVVALGTGGAASLAGGGPVVVGARLWSVVVVTGITWGLLLIAGVAGVLAATVLPYPALVIADMWADRSLT